MLIDGLTNRLLGYPPDARLLIINADDFGMCHAVNEAITRSLAAGVVRSTTLMVPCPWARHAIRFLADHPEVPFGVHLTAICDWAGYRWGPLLGAVQVPSLVNGDGHFYDFDHMGHLFATADLGELAAEFRAQIDTVLAAGLRPTHLDWHCLRLNGQNAILDLLADLAAEYGLALRAFDTGQVARLHARGLPAIDGEFLDSYLLDLATKADDYARLLRELPAGLSEWAVHPGLHTSELLAIEGDTRHVRQSDLDFLVSPRAAELIAAEGVILIDYRALQTVWQRGPHEAIS
jgi:predicted glycoside hydrolase/deacetylase ChbG (UPF0249 family)